MSMQMHMPQAADNSRSWTNSATLKLIGFGLIAVCIGALAVKGIPESMMTLDTGTALAAAAILFVVLLVPLTARSRGAVDDRQFMLLTGILLWSYLLVAERLFYRFSTVESAYEGDFASAAYAEAMIWAFCFLVLFSVSLKRPTYITKLFSPAFRWVTMLAILCIVSSVYSPAPTFSFAWAIKLFLAVLLLRVIFSEMQTTNDLRSFLRATLWSFAVLVALCMIEAIGSPDGIFNGGRLTESVSPTGVSSIAGTLFLLAVTFFYWEKRTTYLWVAGFGVMVMVFGGGKTAILAAFLAGTLYFVLRKNIGSGLLFLGSAAAFGAILVAVTPLHSYLSYYLSSGQADTATGRTELWQTAVPRIWDDPLLGHGFVASKFVSIDVSGIHWAAGHMHNGFLEVLYNNGLLGLVLLLAFNFRILRNLYMGVRYADTAEVRNIANGAMAIYVYLLINGMFNASFGGRPTSAYLMMLALVVVSEAVVVLAQPKPASASALAAVPERA